MKTLALIGTSILVLAACDPYMLAPSFGMIRSDTTRRHPRSGTDTMPDGPAIEAMDTTLYFSAVRFPQKYDWQRDTAYGASDYEIILYKDFGPVLTIKSGSEGTCPDPDMQHIIDGHLFIRHSSPAGTTVSMDGNVILRIDGKEVITGIFPRGDSIYTLGEPASGGFVLRKDGAAILEAKEGCVFGSLTEPSYRPYGALYEDDGGLCFCYYAETGNGYELFHVRDNVVTKTASRQSVSDMKLVEGVPVIADGYFGTGLISEGRVWRFGPDYMISGQMFNYSEGRYYSGVFDSKSGQTVTAAPMESLVYVSTDRCCAVSTDNGAVFFCRDGTRLGTGMKAYFFSGGCADISGRKFVAAIAPKDRSIPPFIWSDGSITELDLYGYVSCVKIELSPPTK